MKSKFSRTRNLRSLPVGLFKPGEHGREIRDKYFRLVMSEGLPGLRLDGHRDYPF